jgi:4-diphosphocytidyl-2-C-methyl-D-erythritol kinase
MSDRAARVLAQAKINVFLHVYGPRPDGYHELLTLFQRLDLADEITIRASSDTPSRSLDVTGPRMPAEGLGPATSNLAYRAAAEFHERTGWPRGFEIGLTKNIPVGGGLGGGSADAAAVLRALNAMAPAPLDDAALHDLAASLGSDVPFLASERVAAIAAGRGEMLEPAWVRLRSADVLLVVPSFSIGTADAYRWLRESGHYFGDDKPRPRELPSASRWKAMDLGNTFEPVIEDRHPELRNYREQLGKAGATIARMSGSGSTVFGLFESGVPVERQPAIDALVIRTRTAEHVVQVEAQE